MLRAGRLRVGGRGPALLSCSPDGLKKALAGLGLLDDALALDMRKPQDYFTDARRRTAQDALGRVRDAIRQIKREKAQPSVAAVARRAGVSRSFVYDNPEARAAVSDALAKACKHRAQMLAETGDQLEATWRERALNAEDALKGAHAEITAQRARIGEVLGQVRDLEAKWTKEAITRITTLKQRVRQLTTDNRTLEERLQAARSNNRFADRRIAQLEAELADPRGVT